MPKFVVYSRVSTKDQSDAISAQNRIAMSYMNYACDRADEVKRMNGETVEQWEKIGPLEDMASAFKLPFHKRPTGRLICEMLQRGDHLVVARVDRLVRLGKDFELQTEEWKARGVTVHFADLGISMGTAAGDLMARVFAAFAQYFSESLSERQKASWRERYVHGTKFHNKNKVLVRKVKRADGSHVTVPNREAIVYLRYIVWRRRSSARLNGVPDSWQQCSDDLERARVRRGDIPEYRPDQKREQWCHGRVQDHVHNLLTSELPALKSERLVMYFRDLPSPFNLGRKPSGQPRGYRHRPRQRDTIYEYARSIDNPLPIKPPKRWSFKHDRCLDCGRTDRKHFGNGLCRPCYNAAANAAQSNTNDNGQPTEAA